MSVQLIFLKKIAVVGAAAAAMTVTLTASPVAAAAPSTYPRCTAARTDECREEGPPRAYHPHYRIRHAHHRAETDR